MKNLKTYLDLDTVIKLGVSILLLVAATTRQPYVFYNFLRWGVMLSAIFFGYKAYMEKQMNPLYFIVSVGILFNPFAKFVFSKETWHLIDFVIAGAITASMIYDFKQKGVKGIERKDEVPHAPQ